jgi:hypothetical protein
MHTVQWDRTDGFGNKVQGGLYIYRIKVGATGSIRQGLVVAR